MGRCKISKFNGTLSDDSLDILGYLRLRVYNTDEFWICLRTSGLKVKAVGNVLVDGGSEVVSTNANQWKKIAITGAGNNGGYILVPKYDTLTLLNFYGSDSEDYKYTPVTQFSCSFAEVQRFDIGDFIDAHDSLTLLRIFDNSEVVGTTLDLIKLKDTLTSLVITQSDDSHNQISGSFDDLGYLYKLNTLSSTFKFMSEDSVGTVEGFVANRLTEQPNTAGSITVRWLGDGGRVTYQGQPIANKEDNTIAWDSQGNITLT